MRKVVSIALSVFIIVILLVGVSELPKFGEASNPANNYVSQRYLEKGVDETGAQNIVTAVILEYRAFDTFIEAVVLFSAAIAVIVAMKGDKK